MADSASRKGGRSVSPEVIDYVNRVHVPHDAGLARAYDVPAGIPAIQVGPSDGQLVALLLKLLRAEKVVEIGTLVGYSAIHIARALAPGGHVWSVEFEPRHAEVARANWAAAGVADRVTVHVGAALDVLPTLEPHGPFDAVFIDADKNNYARYGQWALDHLRPGGLVLGDNSYLFGELLEDSDRARAMRAFHELVAAHCDSVCAPTPEGLVVGIKR
jgi:caffeoyl-CoA O-methyltransferase